MPRHRTNTESAIISINAVLDFIDNISSESNVCVSVKWGHLVVDKDSLAVLLMKYAKGSKRDNRILNVLFVHYNPMATDLILLGGI